jgi:chitosanase
LATVDGDDPDSIGAIIKRKEGGPVDGNEEEWIRQFLKIRRDDLVYPDEESTQDEWSQSVDRVDAMVKLLDDVNLDMNGPIRVKTPNHSTTIP